ncbi:MAG TPA: c-type cytochrome [Crocinitomicaceae bacterium]|nr:c-type cytochrome [Crocinitomicaceae bacterium]
MKMNYIHKITAGIVLSLALTSCFKDENSAGYEYMPDMYRSPAIEAYVDYGEIRGWQQDTALMNKQSSLLPPMGTIPFVGEDTKYNLPYHRLPSENMVKSHSISSLEFSNEDYGLSAEDPNPMKLTQTNHDKGEVLYNRYCTSCHGEKGQGDGKVANNESINPPASAFTIPDGRKFYSITYGRGVMGAHASQLNQKERWQVISYINAMNGAPIVADEVETVEEAKPSLAEGLASLMNTTSNSDSHGEHGTEEGHGEAQSLALEGLVFATGSANLDEEKSAATLETLLEFMKSNHKTLILEGHTDNTGNAGANLKLSGDRAAAVKTYLTHNGIDAKRIESIGFGSTKPAATNDTEEGRAQNRRTEVKIK